MADVYSLATVTISATAADNCNGGLSYGTACRISFGKGEKRQQVQLDLSRDPLWGEETRTFAAKTAINTRAWTLQEHILSSRVLIFTAKGLGWLCAGGNVSPPGNRTHISQNYDFQLVTRKKEPLRMLWDPLVSNYTRRKLSKPEDKLPAFAAVARTIHELKGDKYLAGLWEQDLQAHLMWTTNVSGIPRVAQRRPPEYRAPSWSWMSLDAAVSSPYELIQTTRWQSEIESCYVSPANPDDPFGQVTDSILTIRGPMVRMTRIQGEGDPLSYRWPECYAVFRRREYRLGDAVFDTPQDEAEARRALEESTAPIVALFIRYTTESIIYAIILTPTGEEPVRYRRIGAVKWDEAGMWGPNKRIWNEKLPLSTVVII
jgi:hypothetical protein